MTRSVCVIQARCGSSRLPGKVLMPLAGRPAIAHVIERARAIEGIDAVVCATTSEAKDDPLVPVAEAAGAIVFRGDEHDVLGRYRAAAPPHAPDMVMRVTGDCPLLDPEICARLLARTMEAGAAYGGHSGWPHGLDCEVFTHALLAEADARATSALDREHVTLWMKRRDDLRKVHLAPERDHQADNRWVLDYPEDYEFLRAVFDRLPQAPGVIPSWRDVLAVVDAEPELRAINRARGAEWRAANDKIHADARKP